MAMQFLHIRLMALLVVIHGAALVSGVDVSLDHRAAQARLVRKPDEAAQEQVLLRDQYLPPHSRHTATDILDAHRMVLLKNNDWWISDNILKHIPDDESCLAFDVGAGIGVFTDQILKHSSNCQVVAFEPVEDMSSYLVDHHRHHPNVVVVNQAVADLTGRKILYQAQSDQQSSSLNREDASMTPVPVMATTLTDYAASHDLLQKQAHAIRVDVGGAEWRVLNGMRALVKGMKQKPIIIVTIGDGKEEARSTAPRNNELQWFFDNGYQTLDHSVKTGENLILMPKVPFVPQVAVPEPTLPPKLSPSPAALAVIRIWGLVVIISVALMSGVWWMKARKTDQMTARVES